MDEEPPVFSKGKAPGCSGCCLLSISRDAPQPPTKRCENRGSRTRKHCALAECAGTRPCFSPPLPSSLQQTRPVQDINRTNRAERMSDSLLQGRGTHQLEGILPSIRISHHTNTPFHHRSSTFTYLSKALCASYSIKP